MSAKTRVLITGGSRGVGRATALRLAQEGAAVALLARSQDDLDATVRAVREAGGTAVAVVADVGDATHVRGAVDAAIAALGGLDGLVLNAGIGVHGPVETYRVADWQEAIATMLTGPFLVTQAALPALKAAGDARIVAVGSGAAYAGYANLSSYCAAKWGLRGFLLALAEEVKADGIRCCYLSPGSILTTFGGRTIAEKQAQPGKAFLQPEDVADAIASLLAQPAHVWTQEMNLWPA
ncbi:MAG: SDR family oxidoreductase [Chloroflexota bacterium]|nr:SDR family oxidoreductase [Chloroflexota bacterium]